jgi:glycerol-3-phosphate dehydrogenase (NAD(P)+)
MKKKITVIGEGAWGTALATLFARNGYTVTLWCYHAEIAHEINTAHTNTRYLPDFTLPDMLVATASVTEAVHDADYLCEAVPVQYLRSVMMLFYNHLDTDMRWIITSKGIEQETLLLPASVVSDMLGYEPQYAVAVGPSFARDVMQEEKTGLVVAATHDTLRAEIMQLFTNNYMSCVPGADTHGAQLCAAFKNVVALLVGISDGKGNGDNTRALLVTHCFQAMAELVQKSGGSLETVLGLAGIGDLFLTAASTQSRNYLVGKALGEGESLQSIIERTGFTPEGVNTLYSIRSYAQRYGITLDALIGEDNLHFF